MPPVLAKNIINATSPVYDFLSPIPLVKNTENKNRHPKSRNTAKKTLIPDSSTSLENSVCIEYIIIAGSMTFSIKPDISLSWCSSAIFSFLNATPGTARANIINSGFKTV